MRRLDYDFPSDDGPRQTHGGIYETIPFGVWMCDSDGGLRYASDSFLELLSLSMTDASGFGWTERMMQGDGGSVERWKRTVAEGRDWDDEHQVRDRNGEVRTMIARGHPVRDDSGAVTAWIGVHLDITERKRDEQRIKDARSFAEGIIETVPNPLLVLDSAHRVVTANPAFYRHFKTQRPRTVGRQLWELGDGQWNIPGLKRLLDEVLRESASFNDYEVEHDFPDLGQRIILVNGRRMFQQGERKEMILLVFQDVTEQRRAEERLRLVKGAEMEQQERTRLARLLHDHVQQLLVAAQLQSGFAAEQAQSDEVKSVMAKIQEILGESIDATRSLSMELNPPVLKTGGIVAAMNWLADQMRKNHDFRVEVHGDGDVELPSEQAKSVLFQSVRELLLNSRKHSRIDHATIELATQGGETRVVVADGGVGFDPATVRAANDATGGSGLFNIRERLELVGGKMEIDSAPGQGARVLITIPGGE